VRHENARTALKKGLGITQDALANGWIADMTETRVSFKGVEALSSEYVLNQTNSSVTRESAFAIGVESTRVLAAVLDRLQRRANRARDRLRINQTNKAAHGRVIDSWQQDVPHQPRSSHPNLSECTRCHGTFAPCWTL